MSRVMHRRRGAGGSLGPYVARRLAEDGHELC